MSICNNKLTTLQELYKYIINVDNDKILEILYDKYLNFFKMNKQLFFYEDMSVWFTFLIDFEKALSSNVNEQMLIKFVHSQATIYQMEHKNFNGNHIDEKEIEKTFYKIVENNILLKSLIKKHELYILIHRESHICYKGIFCKEYFSRKQCNIIHIYETKELDYKFILAHELGHYIFENIFKYCDVEIEEKEKIADKYADTLLRSIL